MEDGRIKKLKGGAGSHEISNTLLFKKLYMTKFNFCL